MNKYILLWLEGPLQSWGYNSKFGRRETLVFPTKSAIYGMFLAAMGKRGEQKEFLETIAGYKQTVISYSKSHKKNKADDLFTTNSYLPKLLTDYHMIGSGYDNKDPWQNLLIPKKRDGTTPNTGGAKITYRYYLQDAKFSVIQEMESSLAEKISQALYNPTFEISLGRKSCVPTEFINQGVFDSYNDALEQANQIKNRKELIEQFRVFEEEGLGEQFILDDVPLQFGQFKKYKSRIVSLVAYG